MRMAYQYGDSPHWIDFAFRTSGNQARSLLLITPSQNAMIVKALSHSRVIWPATVGLPHHSRSNLDCCDDSFGRGLGGDRNRVQIPGLSMIIAAKLA